MKNVNDFHVHRYDNPAWTMVNESIAVESLVHLRVNDEHASSLLASPGDLEDLLIGHMATEYGLAYQVQDRIKLSSNGEELFAHLHTERTPTIEARTAIVTSSCGACDQSNLSSLIQTMPSVPSPNKPVSLDVVTQHITTGSWWSSWHSCLCLSIGPSLSSERRSEGACFIIFPIAGRFISARSCTARLRAASSGTRYGDQ